MNFGFLELDSGYQSPGFQIPQAKISLSLEMDCLTWDGQEENQKTPRGWGGGGEGAAIYGLYSYLLLRRVWFSSSLLWNRVYKSES